VVLKRPAGSDGPFGEHAELPKYLGQGGRKNTAHQPLARAKKSSTRADKAADRKAPKRTNGNAGVVNARRQKKRRSVNAGSRL